MHPLCTPHALNCADTPSSVQVCEVHVWPWVHSALTWHSCATVPPPVQAAPAATVWHVVLADDVDPQQTCPPGQSQASLHWMATLSGFGQAAPEPVGFNEQDTSVTQIPRLPSHIPRLAYAQQLCV